MADEEVPGPILQFFRAINTSGSGKITRDELAAFVQRMPTGDALDIDELMGKMDQDRDGQLTAYEFWLGAKQLGIVFPGDSTPNPDDQGEEYDVYEEADLHTPDGSEAGDGIDRSKLVFTAMRVFDDIDDDNSMSLDEDELLQVLRRLGVTDADAGEQLLAALDEDGNGSVSRDEFLEAVQHGQLDQFLAVFQEVEGAEDYEITGVSKRHGEDGPHSPMRKQRESLHVDDDKDLFKRQSVPKTDRSLPPRTEMTQDIAAEQYQYLWDLYCVADDDDSGSISEYELQDLLNDASIFGERPHMSIEVIRAVLEDIDEDGSGTLDFDEFCVAFNNLVGENAEATKGRSLQSAEQLALLNENEQLRQEIKKWKDEASELKAQLSTNASGDLRIGEHELQELEDDLADKEQELSQYKDKTLQLEISLREARHTIDTLQESLDYQKELNAQYMRGNFGSTYTEDTTFSEVDELRREIQVLTKQMEEERTIHYQQIAMGEIQLDEMNFDLIRIPGMPEGSFLASLSKEDREAVLKLKAAFGSAERRADLLAMQLTTLEDAKDQLYSALHRADALEKRHEAYVDRSQRLRVDLQEQVLELTEAKEALEQRVGAFEPETRKLIGVLQNKWDEERELLHAELEEARVGQRHWQNYLKTQGTEAKLNAARSRLMSKTELQQELEEARRELDVLTDSLQAAEAAVRERDEQIERLLAETNAAAATELETAQRQLQQLDQDNAALSAQLEEAKTAHERIALELRTRIEQLEELATEGSKQRVLELEQELQRLREDLERQHESALQQRLLEANAHLDQTIKALKAQHREEMSEKQALIDTLRAQLSEKAESVTQLTERVEVLTTTITTLETTLEDTKGELAGSATELGAKANELRDARAMTSTAQLQIDKLERELEASELERDRLFGIIEDLNKRLKQLEEQVAGHAGDRDRAVSDLSKEMTQQRQEFVGQLTVKEEELQHLRKELESLSKRLHDKELEAERTAKTLREQLASANDVLATHKEATGKTVEEMQGQLLALQEQLVTKTTEITQLTTTIETQRLEHDRLLQEAQEDRDQGQFEMQDTVTQLQAQLEQVREARRKAVEEFSATLSSKQDALKALQSEKEAAIAELNAKIRELRAEQDAQRATLDEALAAADRAKADLQRQHARTQTELQSKIDALQVQLDSAHSKRDQAGFDSEQTLTSLQVSLEHAEATLASTKAAQEQELKARADAYAQLEEAKRDLETQFRTRENELQGTISDLQDSIAALEREVARLKAADTHKTEASAKKIERLEHDLKLVQGQLADQRDAAGRDASSTSTVTVTEVTTLKTEVRNLKRQLGAATSKHAQSELDTQMRIEELEAMFESERMQHQLKVEALQAELAELQSDLDSNESDKAKASATMLARIQQKDQELEAEREKHARELHDLEVQMSTLQQQLLTAQSEHRDVLIQEKRTTSREISRLERLVRDAERKCDTAQGKEKEYEDVVARAKGDVARLKTEHQTALRERIALLESQHLSVVQGLNARLRDMQTEVDAVHADRAKSAEEFAALLKSKDRAMAEQQQRHLANVNELTDKISSLEAEVTRLQDMLAALSAPDADEASKSERFTLQLAEYRSQVNNLQGELARVQGQRGMTQQEADALRAQHAAKVQELTVLHEATVSRLTQQLDALKAKVGNLEDQVAASERSQADRSALSDIDKRNLQTQISDLKHELEGAMDRNAALRTELSEERAVHNSLKIAHQMLQQQMEETDKGGIGEAEHQQYLSELQQLRSKVAELELLRDAALADAKRKTADAATRMKEQDALFDAERSKLEEEVRTEQLTIVHLRQETTSVIAQRDALQRRIAELEAKLSGAGASREDAARAFELQISQLHTQLTAARDELATHIAANASGGSGTEDAAALAAMKAQHAQQVDDLNDRLRAMTTQLAAAVEARDVAVSDLATVKHALGEAEDRLEAAQRDAATRLADFEADRDAQRNHKLHALQELETRYKTESDRLREAVQEAQSNEAALAARVQALQQELEQAQRDHDDAVAAAQAQRDALDHELTQVRGTSEQTQLRLTYDLEDQAKHIAQLKAEIEQLEGRLRDVVLERDTLQSAAAGDKATLESATQARIDGLLSELESTRKVHDDRVRAMSDASAANSKKQLEMLGQKNAQIEALKHENRSLGQLNDKLTADKTSLVQELEEARRASKGVSGRSGVDRGAMDATLAQLRHDLERTKQALADKDREAMHLADTMDEMEHHHRSALHSNEHTRQDLYAQLDAAKRALQRATHERATALQQSQQRLEEQRKLVSKLLSEKGALSTENHELALENAKLEGQIKNLIRRADAADSRSASLLEPSSSLLDAEGEDVTALKAQLLEAQGKLSHTEGQLLDVANQAEIAKANSQELVGDLKSTVRELESELAMIKSQLRDSTAQRDAATTRYQDKLQHAEQLTARKAAEVARLKEELSHIEAKLKRLQDASHRSQAELITLRSDKTTTLTSVSSIGSADVALISSLRSEADASRSRANRLEEELKRIRGALAHRDALIAALEGSEAKDMPEVQAQIRGLNLTLDSLQRERDERLGDFEGRTQRYRQQLQAKNDEIAQLRAQLNEQRSNAATTQGYDSASISLNDTLQSESEQLKARIHALEMAKNDLEAQLTSTQRKLSLAPHSSQIDTLVKMLEDVQREREAAASQYKHHRQTDHSALAAQDQENARLVEEIQRLLRLLQEAGVQVPQNGTGKIMSFSASGDRQGMAVVAESHGMSTTHAATKSFSDAMDMHAVVGAGEEVAQLRRENQSLKEMVTQLSGGDGDPNSRLKQLQLSLKKALDERERAAQMFGKKIEELNNRLRSSNEARNRLTEQLARLGGSVLDGSGDQTTATHVQRELESLRTENNQLKSQILRLGSSLSGGEAGGAKSDRVRQLEIELDKSLRERDQAAKDFHSKLHSQQQRIKVLDAERHRLLNLLQTLSAGDPGASSGSGNTNGTTGNLGLSSSTITTRRAVVTDGDFHKQPVYSSGGAATSSSASMRNLTTSTTTTAAATPAGPQHQQPVSKKYATLDGSMLGTGGLGSTMSTAAYAPQSTSSTRDRTLTSHQHQRVFGGMTGFVSPIPSLNDLRLSAALHSTALKAGTSSTLSTTGYGTLPSSTPATHHRSSTLQRPILFQTPTN
eukprot:m.360696 g.360696  ORF g.360696 m.360696 type:complete len:3158 (-) comp19147_c0_seq1:385-9858(-)